MDNPKTTNIKRLGSQFYHLRVDVLNVSSFINLEHVFMKKLLQVQQKRKSSGNLKRKC